MTADLPAEAVEAAARALYLDDCRRTWHDERDRWDQRTERERDVWRRRGQPILAAAVPSLREAWETELREQIAWEIEAAGRSEVERLAGDETQLGRWRLIGAEDAYKAAVRIARRVRDV
jgi:hypothetical protein